MSQSPWWSAEGVMHYSGLIVERLSLPTSTVKKLMTTGSCSAHAQHRFIESLFPLQDNAEPHVSQTSLERLHESRLPPDLFPTDFYFR